LMRTLLGLGGPGGAPGAPPPGGDPGGLQFPPSQYGAC
jgi:hypothetical protein